MTAAWRVAIALLATVGGVASAAEPGGPLAVAGPDAEAMAVAPDEADLATAEGLGSAPPRPAAEAAQPEGEGGEPVLRAWFTPADSLEQRVWRTRRRVLEFGIWSLDPAARAMLAGGGDPVEHAEAAVRLAPDLPSARMELAAAQWLHGGSALTAVRTAASALGAFGFHPEGGLWLAGSLAFVLAAGLIGGGLLCIAVLSAFHLPHAAHDLGDRVPGRLPPFAAAALLAALLLAPAAAGCGVLGVALGLLVVASAYGKRAERVALACACAAVLLGAWPVARLAGATLEGLPADPVARAALATSSGLPLASDLARLEAAPDTDLLALQARARLARRAGHLGRADALYQTLLEKTPRDVVVLNNAANVRLHLGHMESALELYRRALDVEESPVVLFNLSQAYGRAFQVDDLTAALERAQALDGELVADLTRLQGTQPEGFVVDLPLPTEALWRRVVDLHGGEPFAAALRASIAPDWLGRHAAAAAAALLAALAAGSLAGRHLRASHWCPRCGRRVCPRCDAEAGGGELCQACIRLFFQPEQTDRTLRLARIEALRGRQRRFDRIAWAVAIALPGAAGRLCRRPLRSLVGTVLSAVALAAIVWRHGPVPDPLVAGAAGPLAFLCVASAAGLGYAVVVGASLAARRRL